MRLKPANAALRPRRYRVWSRKIRITGAWQEQMIRRPFASLMLIGLLGGCSDSEQIRQLVEPEIASSNAEGPPNSVPGTCWGRETQPAVIETVTEKEMLRPAEIDSEGTVLSEAEFDVQTTQRIVENRREIWFETPCPDQVTPEFTKSLQRALAARGLFDGALTGQMDDATRDAVRDFQSASGLDSEILSLAASRKLGLLPYEVERVSG